VCLLEPGTFKTGIFFENRRRGEHFDLEGPYGKLNHRLEEMTTKSAREAPGPEPVAAKIAELIAMSARPPFRTVVGGQAQAMAVLRRLVPDAVYAGGVRRFLGIERSS